VAATIARAGGGGVMADGKSDTTDLPEVEPTWKLQPVNAQGLRNAIRDIIYKSFDDEAATVANILYAMKHHHA
jgi:hypothetical protein